MSCGQTVEKQLGAGESSFALSSLEMSKRYIVTIIAYKGNKRSKVVETIFRTGVYCMQIQSLLSSPSLQIKCMILRPVTMCHCLLCHFVDVLSCYAAV